MIRYKEAKIDARRARMSPRRFSLDFPISTKAIAHTPERAMKMEVHPLSDTCSLRKNFPRIADHIGWVATITREEATEVSFREPFQDQKWRERKREVSINFGDNPERL